MNINSSFIPLHRYLFFVDWQTRGEGVVTTVIKRSEMDGSNVKTIVETELAGYPRDIVIDYQGLLHDHSLLLLFYVIPNYEGVCH